MFDALWLYHCGTMKLPETMLMGGEQVSRGFVEMPFLALAGYHAEHGVVLVDAPYGHEGPKNIGSLVGTLLGASLMDFEPAWSVVPRLEAMGYRASQVDHVLMTHMHYDHTGGMKEVGHATFHVSREEWNTATTVGAFDGLLKGYAISDYRALHAKMSYFDSQRSYRMEEQGIDIFGDGSVLAISLPGHTRGHTGYLFRLGDGREIFHVGDAVYDLRQIHQNYGFGGMAQRVSHDVSEALFTVSTLRRFAQTNPDVELICAHDVALGARCADGPVKL